ncbi:hypothetical protein [Plantactinospora sp. KLBMP9567]|uniref:hypothetical protein n=1 Tax=Plantactinospora sp. KLBMP9567 TaxID=3085900 RepID=UPI002981C938|nr:hypothetical protein [Plantactinospora sp. KLBMP9567]MDW5326041.1 hypothetical protein [Plantactinospora sp. KLBMP9567]
MATSSHWENGESFLMLGADLCEDVGTNARIKPLHLRLIFLAFSRVNSIGHAEFAPGELARALGDVDRYGEILPAKRSTVNTAIRKAIETAAILPGSGERCLILNGDVKRGRSTNYCTWHKLNTDRRRKRSTLVPHVA